jgi:hypothetical protein
MPAHAVIVAVEHDRLQPERDLVPVGQQLDELAQLRDRDQVPAAVRGIAPLEADLVRMPGS